MRYQLSDIDRRNIERFAVDSARCSLKRIELRSGSIRALSNLRINFKYPLSAISGRNGSGKSTILALAACAFHGAHNGWRLPARTLPYYRFSDFFFQAHGEVPVDGVRVRYEIHYDKWKPSENLPEGKGVGYQERWKNKGGKWNDYASRVLRPVAYFGIDRVVPPSERGTIVNQRRYFISPNKKSIAEDSARDSVSRVLGVKYEDLELRGFGAYKLPLVSKKEGKYSGFNMGAGEQALFALFLAIHSAPKAALFVIDELELGLHEAAQRQLIHELKEVTLKSAHQFIFTTHSPAILGALPPEGRFFIDNTAAGTHVIEGVSPGFAAGRLSGQSSEEVCIYLEDVSAEVLLSSYMSIDDRRRVRICEVGSNSAVVMQMAARFVDGTGSSDVLCVLDGDQRAASAAHMSRFLGLVPQKRRQEAEKWFEARLKFLPSDMPPERYVLSQIRDKHLKELSAHFGIDVGGAQQIIDRALLMGDHGELYWMAQDLHKTEEDIWRDLCLVLKNNEADALSEVLVGLRKLLE